MKHGHMVHETGNRVWAQLRQGEHLNNNPGRKPQLKGWPDHEKETNTTPPASLGEQRELSADPRQHMGRIE